ncbi:hypothetical protein TrRE_jg2846, partial [Triparma retinervis]
MESKNQPLHPSASPSTTSTLPPPTSLLGLSMSLTLPVILVLLSLKTSLLPFLQTLLSTFLYTFAFATAIFLATIVAFHLYSTITESAGKARKRAREVVGISKKNTEDIDRMSVITPKEQDYLRRVSRHLLARTLKGTAVKSPILRSLCVEILGNAVFNPVMNLFTPETVNGWISAALEGKGGGGDEGG